MPLHSSSPRFANSTSRDSRGRGNVGKRVGFATTSGRSGSPRNQVCNIPVHRHSQIPRAGGILKACSASVRSALVLGFNWRRPRLRSNPGRRTAGDYPDPCSSALPGPKSVLRRFSLPIGAGRRVAGVKDRDTLRPAVFEPTVSSPVRRFISCSRIHSSR